jgi:tripartite-type tricarboxylate transporter receptor subunit TctC
MNFIKTSIAISLLTLCSMVNATEQIKIYSPYSVGHSSTPALFKIVDKANESQNVYKFIVDFKPGGNQIISVKSLDENSIAIIAPAFVENVQAGKLSITDYTPIFALGDACWSVITNKPITGQKEFVVGGVGYGNASHLTALALGEKYKFDVRYIVFKSNNDALINMAGNNGIEFVIDKYESYSSLRTQSKKLSMVAASCPKRLPQEPTIKTLKELGIKAPYIFNIVVAHKDMSKGRQTAIGIILTDATAMIGEQEIFRLGAVRPPQFDNISVHEFYTKSIKQVQELQTRYRTQIDKSSQ